MIIFFVIALILIASLLPATGQELLISIALILVNVHFYRKRVYSFWGLIISVCITCFYIIMTYVQYYNAVSLGFSDGILYGTLGGLNYDDMYSYFYVSQWTSQVITGTLADMWWNGDLVFLEGFNMYHPFVIFNAFLHIIFGSHLITFIFVKLFFSVFSIFFLYKIARYFLSKNYSWTIVAVFFLLPANILVSTCLMRDNLLLFLVLCFFYLLLRIKNHEKTYWQEYFFLILVSILMIVFRVYYILIIFSVLIYWIISIKMNWKRLFISTIVVASIITIGMSYINLTEFSLQVLSHLEGGSVWDTKTTEGANIYIYWLYYLFLGQTPIISDINFNISQDILNHFAFFSHNFVLFAFFVSFVSMLFINKSSLNKKMLLIFGFVLPSSLLLLHNIILGFPIPRIYIAWLWIDLIIIGVFTNQLNNVKKIGFVFGVVSLILFYFLLRTN